MSEIMCMFPNLYNELHMAHNIFLTIIPRNKQILSRLRLQVTASSPARKVVLNCNTTIKLILNGKGKGHPITGHEGPEGEQMYSSTLPSASVLDGGG